MPSSARSAAHRGANVDAVLADAAGEHDRVGAAQLDQHRAQAVANVGREHVERQPGPRVALGGGFFQIAHVAADAAQAQQPAPLGQVVQHLRPASGRCAS